MTFVYLMCFILIVIGIILLLGLNPDNITNDLSHLSSKEPSLREKVLIAKGRKKSRNLTAEFERIKDALEKTGKGSQFAVACATSLLLMVVILTVTPGLAASKPSFRAVSHWKP